MVKKIGKKSLPYEAYILEWKMENKISKQINSILENNKCYDQKTTKKISAKEDQPPQEVEIFG